MFGRDLRMPIGWELWSSSFAKSLGDYGGAHKSRLARWVKRAKSCQIRRCHSYRREPCWLLHSMAFRWLEAVFVWNWNHGFGGPSWYFFGLSLLEAQSEKQARKRGKERVFRRRSISLLPLLSFCGTKNCARPGCLFLPFEIRDLTGHSLMCEEGLRGLHTS